MEQINNLKDWHKVVKNQDWQVLSNLLSEDVEFHSPFLWQPKKGREITAFILKSVSSIFQEFTYHREWVDGNEFALEFSAKVGELQIKGIDLLHWNENNQIAHFEVMIRPANGLLAVGQLMSEKFKEAGY